MALIGSLLLLVTGFANAATVEEYDGEPRVWYDYAGDEPNDCEEWKAGDITTDQFQSRTSYGEGTAALEQKPMYNDYPREFYEYSGSEQSDYESWKAGNQTTDQFQSRTSYGEGTASLELLPLYQDYPRAWYDYTGSEQSEYEEWKNGNQNTYNFQTDTSRGEGTAALELNPSCRNSGGEDDGSETPDINVEVSQDPSSPTTDDSITLRATTGNTRVDQITILRGEDSEKVCSSTSACSVSIGPLSSGTYTYQATVQLDSETDESDTAQLVVEEAESDDGDDGDNPPGTPGNDSQTIQYDLSEGWNMISVPTLNGKTQFDITDLNGECSIQETADGSHAYNFPSDNGNYIQTDTISAMQGYWVSVASACTATIESSNMEEGSTDAQISQGWNLISPDTQTTLSSISGDCSFLADGEAAAYWYNTEQGQYQSISETDGIDPSRGYWVEAESSCSLGVEGPPSAPE